MRIRKSLTALAVAIGLACGTIPAQATLIGLTPSEPALEFGASGIVSYDAATGIVTISGVPATLFRNDPFLFGEVVGTGPDDEKLITIRFRVDAAGNLVSGVDGPDLVVTGAIDVDFDGVADYEGVLLEAEVLQFGFENGAAGDDFFDLRLGSVGGALAPLYVGGDLALRVVSEASTEYPNPFGGSFAANFVGLAKGAIGATEPLQVASCKIDVEAYCSVDGGHNKSACRIQATKSPHHWAYEDRSCHRGNVSYRRHTYGMHNLPMPGWASSYRSTEVKFTYVIKNTGDTPITDLLVDDSFDAPVSGVPASLAPGQSVAITRRERLRETMSNIVLVTAHYQSATCGDTDTVVIKDKLRERRRHDDDRFKDKGHGHHY